MSSPSPQEPIPDDLWKDLLALASDPRNTVVVISGRERALVSQWLGDLPVWIAAENGLYYRQGGRSAEWQSEFENLDDEWIGSITPVFRYFAERTPGSVTETQEHSITWHYREADEDFGEIQASVLQEHLEKVLGNQPVEVSFDSKQVQVRPYAVSKGAVLEPLMEACTDYSRSKPTDEQFTDERESNTASQEAGSCAHWTQPGLSGATGLAAVGAVGIAAAASAVSSSSLSNPAGVAPGAAGLTSAAATAALPHLSSGVSSTHRLSIDRSVEPSEAGSAPLGFVLCVGCHNMRDEDLFGNVLSREVDDVPYADYLPPLADTWTCRVGQQPSQAAYFLNDERDVGQLLAALSSISQAMPPPDGLASSSVFGDDGQASLRGVGDDTDFVASALDHLSEIESLASGKQLAFFLDYDGTLTPIVENPNDAVLSEEARSVVRSLATRYPTAIVSGRARATAQGLVQLDELYYAGSHGFDITGPLRPARGGSAGAPAGADGESEEPTEGPTRIAYQVADSFRPALEEAKAHVEAAIANIKGALVEDNTFSVSVHYRMVAEGEDRERVQEVVDSVVNSMPMLRRTEGKMVYELRPSAEWDKGKAVEWLLEQIKKDFDVDVFPIYIGDDVTDEDAFRMMGGLGGLGIIVSETARNGSASTLSPSP